MLASEGLHTDLHASASETEHASSEGLSASCYTGALGSIAAPSADICIAVVINRKLRVSLHVGCTVCSAGGSWSTNQLIYNAGSSAGDDVMSLTGGADERRLKPS